MTLPPFASIAISAPPDAIDSRKSSEKTLFPVALAGRVLFPDQWIGRNGEESVEIGLLKAAGG